MGPPPVRSQSFQAAAPHTGQSRPGSAPKAARLQDGVEPPPCLPLVPRGRRGTRAVTPARRDTRSASGVSGNQTSEDVRLQRTRRVRSALSAAAAAAAAAAASRHEQAPSPTLLRLSAGDDMHARTLAVIRRSLLLHMQVCCARCRPSVRLASRPEMITAPSAAVGDEAPSVARIGTKGSEFPNIPASRTSSSKPVVCRTFRLIRAFGPHD